MRSSFWPNWLYRAVIICGCSSTVAAFSPTQQLLDTAQQQQLIHIAESFLDTPYVAKTLEAGDDFRLISRTDALDCTTYVETVMSLFRSNRQPLAEQSSLPQSTIKELAAIRYRGDKPNGYGSRLHYFSDWLFQNEQEGRIKDITHELGGITVTKQIDFMSQNHHLYAQLASSPQLANIIAQEQQISQRVRYMIPQNHISAIANQIHNGDIIALTTTIAGLDVSHLGFAYWQDGVLKLLHASTANGVVISEESVAQIVGDAEKNHGIIVARIQADEP